MPPLPRRARARTRAWAWTARRCSTPLSFATRSPLPPFLPLPPCPCSTRCPLSPARLARPSRRATPAAALRGGAGARTGHRHAPPPVPLFFISRPVLPPPHRPPYRGYLHEPGRGAAVGRRVRERGGMYVHTYSRRHAGVASLPSQSPARRGLDLTSPPHPAPVRYPCSPPLLPPRPVPAHTLPSLPAIPPAPPPLPLPPDQDCPPPGRGGLPRSQHRDDIP